MGNFYFVTIKKSTDLMIPKVIILPPFFHCLLFLLLSFSLAQLAASKNTLPEEHKNVPCEASYQFLKRHGEMAREQQVGGLLRAVQESPRS